NARAMGRGKAALALAHSHSVASNAQPHRTIAAASLRIPGNDLEAKLRLTRIRRSPACALQVAPSPRASGNKAASNTRCRRSGAAAARAPAPRRKTTAKNHFAPIRPRTPRSFLDGENYAPLDALPASSPTR